MTESYPVSRLSPSPDHWAGTTSMGPAYFVEPLTEETVHEFSQIPTEES